jgi:hypothetical protein
MSAERLITNPVQTPYGLFTGIPSILPANHATTRRPFGEVVKKIAASVSNLLKEAAISRMHDPSSEKHAPM